MADSKDLQADERTKLLGSRIREPLHTSSRHYDGTTDPRRTLILDEDHVIPSQLLGNSSNESLSSMQKNVCIHSSLKGERSGPLVKSYSISSLESLISTPSDENSTFGNDCSKGCEETKLFLEGISTTQFRFIFGSMLLNLIVGSFDATLMASSHPVITSYFHSSNSACWLSTSFLLTLTAFQPLFGRVSDTFGRRPLYLFTLSVFLLSTAGCALAPNMLSFILARAACGLGAGGVMAMGSFICNDLVAIEIRGMYQSYINLAYGFGAAMGVAFGGLFCDLVGWRWTFGIQIPVISLCLISAWLTTPRDLGPMLIRESQKSSWYVLKEFDLKGSALLSMATTFLVLGLNLGGNVLPWSHPLIMICPVLCLSTAFVLVRVEMSASHPILPMDLLTSQPRANLIFSNFCSAIATNTILFNIPLYLQAVKGETPTVSGVELIFPTVAACLAAVAAGFIITWTAKIKPILLVGSVMVLAGSMSLLFLKKGQPGWVSLLFVIPAVCGQGLLFPSAVMGLLATSPQEDQAVVSSALMLWRSLGTVIGVAVSSLVLQNSLNIYLHTLVTGPFRDEVIQEVRKSVRAIPKLASIPQHQVISSYSHALRITFLPAILASVVMLFLVIPIKLPQLRKSRL